MDLLVFDLAPKLDRLLVRLGLKPDNDVHDLYRNLGQLTEESSRRKSKFKNKPTPANVNNFHLTRRARNLVCHLDYPDLLKEHDALLEAIMHTISFVDKEL